MDIASIGVGWLIVVVDHRQKRGSEGAAAQFLDGYGPLEMESETNDGKYCHCPY
jgi:hypothetical protein